MIMDNKNEVFTNWEMRKMRIKEQHPDISDEDLFLELNKEEEVLKKLMIKTGKTREQIFEWLHMMG